MTGDQTEVQEVIARLEAANGPDEELDRAIMALFYFQREQFIGARDYHTEEELTDLVWVNPKTNRWVSTAPYRFTGSLEHLIKVDDPNPLWEITGPYQYLNIPTHVPNHWRATISIGRMWETKRFTAWGATEPLARCAAALRVFDHQSAAASSAESSEADGPQSMREGV